MSSSQPLIVVPCDQPQQIADSPHLDRLKEFADLRVYRDAPSSTDEKIQRVREAEIIINSRGHLHWSADELRELPVLKMMSTVSIGTDAINLAAARSQGIVVSKVPGPKAPVVAEHALALLLSIARRVSFTTNALRQGVWASPANIYLGNKTLGVIGTGAIGAKMIQLAQGIGMKVLAWTFHPTESRGKELGVEFVDLQKLLAQSDAISIHCKLTDDSCGLIGKHELQKMKAGSLLVNCARGPIVDSHALIEALDAGHLAGAGIDVFDSEPLPENDPILNCDHVVLTPHSADHNPEGVDLLCSGAVENVLAYFQGQPQNVVN